MGKLRIWGNDQNGHWETSLVCSPNKVDENVNQVAESHEGFEDYDYNPDGEFGSED